MSAQCVLVVMELDAGHALAYRYNSDGFHVTECERLTEQSDEARATVSELIEALRGVVAVADRQTDEFDRARAALDRAGGEK